MKNLTSKEFQAKLDKCKIKVLLLGNGFSQFFCDLIKAKNIFAWSSLLDQIVELKEISNELKTSNIEQIMTIINSFNNMSILKHVDSWVVDDDFHNVIVKKLYEESIDNIYKNIRDKFINNFIKIHPEMYKFLDDNNREIAREVITSAYQTMGRFIGCFLPNDQVDGDSKRDHKYSSVYTINYDLILYWILAYCSNFYPSDDTSKTIPKFGYVGMKSPKGPIVCDGFREIEESIYYIPDKHTIHYLHGMLGVFVQHDSIIKTDYQNDNKILDQIKSKLNIDSPQWPLLLLEGDAESKKFSVCNNTFFDVSYNELKSNLKSAQLLCIFGCSFNNDDYLLECIKQSEFNGEIVVIDKLQELKKIEEILPEKVYWLDPKIIIDMNNS